MKLKNKIKDIAKQKKTNTTDKTIYSLSKFIKRLGIKEYKAFDFDSLITNIKSTYIKKSITTEKYFIENIAHTHNSKTNENLFDLDNINLAKNYNENISSFIVENLANQLDNPNCNESDIIHSLNNLTQYTHKKNSDFIEKIDSKYSYKKLAKVKYIDYKNLDKTPVMLTFTPDARFRKYQTSNFNIKGKLGSFENLEIIEENEKKNLQELIENSYEYLNTVFRKFYQHTKTLNMRQDMKDKLDFILIYEPNKSMTMHLHVLIYCNDIQLANLNRSWKHYISGLTDDQKKGQDFKVINRNIATGATYVSKYLIKEYNNTDKQEDQNFFLQYKRYFSKYKLFRTSNFYHTTQKKIDYMYSYFAKNYPDLLEDMKLSETPIYIILEELDIKEIFTFKMEKKNFLSIARKEIKKYFSKMVKHFSATLVKYNIIENIEKFITEDETNKIVSASFQYSYQKLKNIFEKYIVHTENLPQEDIPEDTFYTESMYEFDRKEINESINLSYIML